MQVQERRTGGRSWGLDTPPAPTLFLLVGGGGGLIHLTSVSADIRVLEPFGKVPFKTSLRHIHSQLCQFIRYSIHSMKGYK